MKEERSKKNEGNKSWKKKEHWLRIFKIDLMLRECYYF